MCRVSRHLFAVLTKIRMVIDFQKRTRLRNKVCGCPVIFVTHCLANRLEQLNGLRFPSGGTSAQPGLRHFDQNQKRWKHTPESLWDSVSGLFASDLWHELDAMEKVFVCLQAHRFEMMAMDGFSIDELARGATLRLSFSSPHRRELHMALVASYCSNRGANIRTLSIDDSDLASRDIEELARVPDKLKHLQKISLQNNPRMQAHGIFLLYPALLEMRGLAKLDLSCTGMGDDGCRALAPGLSNAQNLQDLALANNQIGDDGLAVLELAFEFIPMLKRLDLSKNRISEDGCFRMVVAMKNARMSELCLLNLVDNVDLLKLFRVEMQVRNKIKEVLREHSRPEEQCWVSLTWLASLQYEARSAAHGAYSAVSSAVFGQEERSSDELPSTIHRALDVP